MKLPLWYNPERQFHFIAFHFIKSWWPGMEISLLTPVLSILFEGWNFLQRFVALRYEINLPAEMLQSVRNHHKLCLVHLVVHRNLLYDFSGNRDVRSFALHEQMRLSRATVHTQVSSLLKLVINGAPFDTEQAFGVAKVGHEVMNNMLPHPFFWRQDNIFSA